MHIYKYTDAPTFINSCSTMKVFIYCLSGNLVRSMVGNIFVSTKMILFLFKDFAEKGLKDSQVYSITIMGLTDIYIKYQTLLNN